MKITQLRCDYMVAPIGFDFKRPSLGWTVLPEAGDGVCQQGYQIQLSDCPNFAMTIFDSGFTASDQSVGVRLETPLKPRTRYYWRVRVKDNRDNQSPWSEPAFFETARYSETWTGKWIGRLADKSGMPQLRKNFWVNKPVKRAVAYVTGVGVYCLFMNGERVGEDILAPFINAYDKWIQYETYDVTSLLHLGENAMGAWLGNGYYAGRVSGPGIPVKRNIYGKELGLLLDLIVEYVDGTTDVFSTDESWKTAQSPFLRSEIYDGEVFDARLVQESWNEPGFDDSAWENAVIIQAPQGKVIARRSVPLCVNDALPCKKVMTTPKGETVLDFGQNMSGWVRFSVNAPTGTEIVLQAGEALDKEGNFYRENMRTALAECRYICRGGTETYAPYMTFFGFRYMCLSGWPGKPDPTSFTAQVIHSRMDQTGNFVCSDERINRLFLNALWGQKSNFIDVPTDCPQRDERMGWTGDAQVFCATACMNMESDAFYRKYLYDMKLEQTQHGYVPVVVPFIIYHWGKWLFANTGWSDAATIVPWNLYLYFGDRAVLEDQFDSMCAWVDYMTAQDTEGNHLYGGFHIGDWLAQDTADRFSVFGATPTELIATAYYAWSANIAAKTAGVLGRKVEQVRYSELYKDVLAAFRREFITQGGRVVSETQTALAIVLYMDLCRPEERNSIADRLAKRIRTDGNRLTTGFLGTPYLCPALSQSGLNEYAYELLLSTGQPSWLYAVERGATTIWERWNGIDENGDFGPASMNSFNHYAYGCIVEWLYRYCAGINPVENAPGFKEIRLSPMPNSQLSYAEASIRTQYGRLACGWRLESDRLVVKAEVPFNTKATICLPDAEGMQVLENGKPVSGCVLTREAGNYRYEYTPNGKSINKRIQTDVLPDF